MMRKNTSRRDALTNSSIYRVWREAVFKRDGGACRICGAREKIEVHHIRPVRDVINTLLIYDIDNGITLCHECHSRTRSKESHFTSMFDAIIADEHVAYLFEPDDVSTANSGVSPESPFDSVVRKWRAHNIIARVPSPDEVEEKREIWHRRCMLHELFPEVFPEVLCECP